MRSAFDTSVCILTLIHCCNDSSGIASSVVTKQHYVLEDQLCSLLLGVYCQILCRSVSGSYLYSLLSQAAEFPVRTWAVIEGGGEDRETPVGFLLSARRSRLLRRRGSGDSLHPVALPWSRFCKCRNLSQEVRGLILALAASSGIASAVTVLGYCGERPSGTLGGKWAAGVSRVCVKMAGDASVGSLGAELRAVGVW